jgi:CTP:phosphocholine cytidylyltransferase-like protein
MSKKPYDANLIQLIKDNREKSIKELVVLTGKTESQIIYIKQKYRIYKKWTENQ